MHPPQFSIEPPSNDTVDRDLIFDVIIAGCGPTGAMLAAELRLHEVRVLVLEKETEPVSFVRIVGLHIRGLELMAMRGLLDRLLERGRQRPAGKFFAAIAKPAPSDRQRLVRPRRLPRGSHCAFGCSMPPATPRRPRGLDRRRSEGPRPPPLALVRQLNGQGFGWWECANGQAG